MSKEKIFRSLEVKNFKSIKHLKIPCKKVNLFIGKPNTGKSNILESIGIFSLPYGRQISNIIRFENMSNLFYDQEISQKIEVKADSLTCWISFEEGKFKSEACESRGRDKDIIFKFDVDFNGNGSFSWRKESKVKFYRFKVLKEFPSQKAPFLLPPYGENLLFLLLTNKELKKFVSTIFKEYGFRVVLKPHESKIEIQKEIDQIIVSYPYSITSETLQRTLFYLLAVETNKDSVLIFEEPESHSFPYYTKYLAERIGLDDTNQFFISTHNPYFLLSLLEKGKKEDIAVFITYFQNYQTQVRKVTEEEIEKIIDGEIDPFFDVERFLEE